MPSHRQTDISLEIEGIQGLCPAGEAHASRHQAERRIPVLSCEGPCIRGEIARLAANLVAREVPSCARACHAEAFFVPHSAMARWVKGADRCLMIDGCFLRCHGRVLAALRPPDAIIHVDALSIHRRFSDVFLMDDVPESERKATARLVADEVVARLGQVA